MSFRNVIADNGAKLRRNGGKSYQESTPVTTDISSSPIFKMRQNGGKIYIPSATQQIIEVVKPELMRVGGKRRGGAIAQQEDPFLSSVVFLLGADRYYSPFNLNIQHLNGLTLSTTQKKYGNHSYFFNVGPYIEITDSNIALGTGVFTIDFWIYMISGGHGDNFSRVGTTGTSAGGFTLYTTTTNPDSINLDLGNGAVGTGTGIIPNATWCHIAFTRNTDTKLRAYLNGVLTNTSGTSSVNLTNSTFRLGVSSNSVERLNAYVDSYRLTKAVRYTSNFDPENDTYLKY